MKRIILALACGLTLTGCQLFNPVPAVSVGVSNKGMGLNDPKDFAAKDVTVIQTNGGLYFHAEAITSTNNPLTINGSWQGAAVFAQTVANGVAQNAKLLAATNSVSK